MTALDFARPGAVYQLGLPPSRIDVLTEISGVDYDEAARTSQSIVVSGLEFRVPDRATLILKKAATGRSRDLEDVRLLEASRDDDE